LPWAGIFILDNDFDPKIYSGIFICFLSLDACSDNRAITELFCNTIYKTAHRIPYRSGHLQEDKKESNVSNVTKITIYYAEKIVKNELK